MSNKVSDENNPNITMKPKRFQGGLEMANKRLGQEVRPNRRGLTVLNQNVIGQQGYPFVVNKRPLTERFASQVSSTYNNFAKETKKQKASVPSKNAFGECIFIVVDENKGHVDQPVPMSSEPTEPITNVDQMEVEMEDIIEDPIVDIDSCDANNQLAVVDYVEDMYAYYRKMESVGRAPPNYMAQQSDINEKMRAILIDWLIEVHDKFELMNETLFLTVNLIDRFLSQQIVMRKKLQLVGLVAMLLACKYEEVSVPVVGDLILISDKAYTRKEILEMENLMVNKLQFNMSLPTPYVFMQRFLKAAQSDQKLEMLSFFLIELALVEYEVLKFPSSMLSASAIYTAQCSIYGFKQWNKACEWHSGYSEDQLQECSKLMVGYHQKAGTGKLTRVYRKYNTIKFKFTSKCEPAVFLLEKQQ